MDQKGNEHLRMPLMAQYSKMPEITVSHVFKIRKEELQLFFMEEYLKVPEDTIKPYCESNNMLKKVDYASGLLRLLASDEQTGIIGDEKDIRRRQSVFGVNTKPLKKITPYWVMLLDQLEDPILRILLIAGIVTLIVGVANAKDWVSGLPEGLSIIAAVIMITIFTSSNDYMKAK